MKNMPNSNTIPSTLSSSNITVFNKQRKCFLIDTLLEQRQKRLAASNKRENETLHCSSISDSNKSHENREKINKMDFEDNNEARFQELKKESVDKEETIEETLPSLCHFECHDVESKEEKNEDENEQRKSLLDTLMKLLPVVQPQSNSNNSNYEVESKSNDSRAGHSQNSFIQQQPQQKLAVAAATAAAASMEFLQRVRLFQQHLTSNGSQIIQHHPNTRQIPSNNSSHSTPNSGPFPSVTELTPFPSFIPQQRLQFPQQELPNNINIFQLKPPMLIQQQSLCWQQFLAAAALRQNPMQTLILANQEMTKRKIVERNLFGNRAETSNFGNSFNARNTLTNNIPPSNRISKNIVHNNSNPRETSNIYLSGNPAKTLTQIQSKRQNKIDLKKKILTKQNRGHNSTTNGSRIGGPHRSSNVKKYRCDICEKTFSRSNTLITHKRIHTGEKPFRCEHCGRAFRQPGNLTRHAYTHTTVRTFF